MVRYYAVLETQMYGGNLKYVSRSCSATLFFHQIFLILLIQTNCLPICLIHQILIGAQHFHGLPEPTRESNFPISISKFPFQVYVVTNLWTAAWHRGGGGRAGTVWELPLPVPENHDALLLVADVLDVLHVVLQVKPGDWARVTAVIVSGFVSLTMHNITRRNGQFGQVHWLWQTKLIFASFRSAVRCAVVIF